MASVSAVSRVSETFAAIRSRNPALNAFIDLTEDRAREQAGRVDEAMAAGQRSGTLAAMPFGVKNLFARAGTFPFVDSLDTVGPLACSVEVLAAAYDAMQGPDARDPVCRASAAEPVAAHIYSGIEDLRIARASGYFETNAEPAVVDLVRHAAQALGAKTAVEIPEAARAMAAASVITRSESANVHLANLRTRANDFDPLIRDRLLSGTLVPASWYLQAQRFRRWHHRQLLRFFEIVDVVLAPATPCPAHRIGEETIALNGRTVSARAAAGLLTAPLSLVGCPVICAPLGMLGGLPVGMQVIAAPWREDLCFRVARALESEGIAKFTVAKALIVNR